MKYIKLPDNFNPDSKTQLHDLQLTLKTLNFPVPPKIVKPGKVDRSITKALKKIQKENKLDAKGNLNRETIAAINTELHHRFITENKYRTASLHILLGKLNIKVDKKEKENRLVGESTIKAIKEFQKKNLLNETGKLSEEVLNQLHDAVIKETFSSKTKKGSLQNTLKKINKIAKLNIDIAEDELKEKILGETSIKLIKAFQEKYRLPVTGDINKATLDKINSVAASKGTFVKIIKVPPVKDLTAVTKTLHL
ncbi:MAG: peptidoglycan-binding domain-containing protein, partial [Ignavibacteria bacterium]